VGTHERTPGAPERRGSWQEVTVSAVIALALFGAGAVTGTWQAIYRAADRRFEDRFGDILALLAIGCLSFAFFSLRRGAQLRRESAMRATSDARFQTVVEHVPAITYTWDASKPAGEAVAPYVSPQLEGILGYRPDEWVNDPGAWIRAIHPEDRDRVIRESDAADESGTDFVAEYRATAKDGRTVWIHDEAVVVERDDQGRPALAQGVMFDITARKQAEEQLRQAEDRYRTIVERVPAVSYVWDASFEQGTAPAEYISPQVEDLLGFSSARMLQEPGLWIEQVHPDDRAPVLRAWEDAVDTASQFTAEYRIHHAGGALLWVRDEAIPISEGTGGRPLYQGVVIDVTRQKDAESELRTSEAELRRLVEQLPVVSYLADGPNVRYIASGIEALTGLPPSGWITPGTWEQMIHPDDRARVMAESDRVDGTRERFDAEYRFVRADGEVVWVHDTAVHSDLDGDPIWLGVMQDVTERGLAQQRLREAEARYRNLVEQLPVVVYIDSADDVSTALYISPQYEQLTGYTAEERLADPELWVRMLHPSDRDRVLDLSRRSNETGEPFDCDYRLIGKDGREVWVRDHAVMIEGPTGSSVWQGVLSDVTGSKRAEDALARRDRILEAAGYAAERFLNANAWTDPIDDVLAALGDAAGSSRAYIFENRQGAAGELLFVQRGEWVTRPELSMIADGTLQRFAVRSNGYARWERLLGAGEVVHGAVRGFPPEERPNLERQSILSVCAVPVFVAGEWWGLIGLDECDEERAWQAAEIDALRVAANTLGAAIGRERAERRLSETESRYRTFVEQIPAITYIQDPSTGRAVYVSPQLESILGYTREELDSETYWDSLHPEDRERVRAEDERTNRTGEPYRVEYRERAKDGHWVWLRDEAVLVRDERGHPLYWQGVRFDISSEKESEQQLRDTERRYRTLVEQMPAITYIEGPPGSDETIYVSPQVEEFFGYSAEEWLRQRRWSGRLHPEDRDRVLASYERAVETGDPFREEYRIVHRDGRPVWVRDESILIRDDQGRPSFRQGVYYDVTSRKETEQQLRRTEERFRTLVEQLPAITYIDEYDPDGETWPTVYMSPQVEQILGYSPDEWRRDPALWLTILHPDDRERALAADRAHYETGEPLVQEFRLLGRNGDVHWMRDEAIMIRDEDGRPRWSQGILIDVTERRQSEQALHEAEERYRGLVESIPAAIYIDTVEELSKAIYMSPQVEQIFGYSPDEWRDQPHLWESGLHPEDRDDVVERVHRLNTTGVTFEAEYRFFNPRRGWVWVHDQAVLIRDADGVALFTQGVMFDITERKGAEQQLREAEERFRGIVEHVPAAIYLDLPDDSFKTVYASPQLEQITGVSAEDWCADNEIWVERVHPEDRAWVVSSYQEAVAAGRAWSAEYRFVRPDGTEVWVHDETTLLHDESGKPTFLQGVMFDVTERRLAEHALRESEQREREAAERLRALDEMKNTFLAAVSHELRSPLTSILGLSLTLERQADGLRDEDRTDMLERLATNARKLDRLLRDLLDIDRLNRGIVSPRYRVTDVGSLVQRTVASLEAAADRNLEVEAESVVLPVDPAKVERIVENLVVNAIRHTLPTDRIWVRVEPAEGGVMIAVDDDGPGVVPELREEIFEPFRQGPTASKSSPGTGIGLSLVASFAELHGGRAWVQERDGGGASFRVYLPSGRVDADALPGGSSIEGPRLEIDAAR
jgi:PAS domain S-box-containing protein